MSIAAWYIFHFVINIKVFFDPALVPKPWNGGRASVVEEPEA